MKHRFYLTGLLAMSALLCAPYVSAQEQSATERTLRRTQTKRAPRTVKKKTVTVQRPELPKPGSLVGMDAAPESHPEQYKAFITKLNNQAKANSPDACDAMAVALAATGTEFCLDPWMEKAAYEGNPVAMHYMGMTAAVKNASPELRYLPPQQRQQLLNNQFASAKEAADWLKKSADRKFVPGMLDYSGFMRSGIGTAKNEVAANKMLLDASRSGSFETRFTWLLQNGRLTRWSDRERTEVAGEIKRDNHLVIYYLSQFAPSSREQVEWLRKAAERGNGAAMYALSSVLSNTKPEESLVLLKAAVAKHDPAAMYVYGSFLLSEPGEYHQKTGLKPNRQLGLAMLRLSAMLGNAQSRRALAKTYFRGDYGVHADLNKAYAHLRWLNTAQRDPISMAAQGFMMLTGTGTKQDIETGTRYISHAANARYSYAQVMLAYAHYKGLGQTKDPRMAVEVLQEAAAAGFAHAYLYIAFLTAKGLHGYDPDPRGAERYVNIASLNLGNAAKSFFDELMKEKDWVITPFPLEKQ